MEINEIDKIFKKRVEERMKLLLDLKRMTMEELSRELHIPFQELYNFLYSKEYSTETYLRVLFEYFDNWYYEREEAGNNE